MFFNYWKILTFEVKPWGTPMFWVINQIPMHHWRKSQIKIQPPPNAHKDETLCKGNPRHTFLYTAPQPREGNSADSYDTMERRITPSCVQMCVCLCVQLYDA